MKALILAGGKGTRLRPLTHTTNKHLLPLAGEPLLFRVIDQIRKSGANEIIINLNEGDTTVPNAVGAAGFDDVKISYIEQKEPNGIMYPLFLAREQLGNSPFIFHAGDNVLLDELSNHVEVFKKKKESTAHLLLTKVDDPSRFGVAVVDSKGHLVSTVEKPKTFVSNLAVTAIYFYRSGVFDALDHLKPTDPQGKGKPEYFPPPLHQWLVDNGHTVSTEEITGHWKDTGTPLDFLIASKLLMEIKKEFPREGETVNCDFHGRIQVGKNSVVRNCRITGDVVVGENCHVYGCELGHNVTIGDGSVVENTKMDNTIIMRHAHINSSVRPIHNAIIGDFAQLHTTAKEPMSLMLGDHSIVNLNQ